MTTNNLLRAYNDQAAVECCGYALDGEVLVLADLVGYKTACKSLWATTVNSPRKPFYLTGDVKACGGEIKRTRYRAFWAELPEQTAHNLVIVSTRVLDAGPDASGEAQPFYLVASQSEWLLPRFVALLNQALDLPIFPAWAQHLWQCGQDESLITALTHGGDVTSAWRVLPDEARWGELIQRRLQDGTIRLE
jgi:hypothetical protein